MTDVLDRRALTAKPLSEGAALPLLVEADPAGLSLIDALPELKRLADHHLPVAGGLLFRGFRLHGASAFREFAAGFGHDLLTYEFGSTPRSKVETGVYTSTEYPQHQHIPLHNEQSYTRDWPMKIWFYCEEAAPEGGETPLADSRLVYRDMPEDIRTRFAERELTYVRNFGAGLDVSWTDVFGTDDRAEVEAFCGPRGIECEWKDDGELRTKQRCQAVAAHPKTGEMVWFNQAHLFHVSNLEPEVRSTLLDLVDEDDLPRNVTYGDGSPIEDETLDVVRGVLERHKIAFSWRPGDVAMLDNMLVAHGRAPFKGPRKVRVAMAEAQGSR
ncbi:MAG TPA: TauD/TfdA family dioxygenase [Hansschlegelia sp.]